MRKRQEKACHWCGSIGLLYKKRTLFCSRSCSMFAREHNRGGKLPIGTKKQSPNGYVMVKVQEGPTKWVQEHRLVMAEVLGRELLSRERIHHKDGVRNHNAPNNLELWTLDHKDPPGVRVVDLRKDSGWVSGLLSL